MLKRVSLTNGTVTIATRGSLLELVRIEHMAGRKDTREQRGQGSRHYGAFYLSSEGIGHRKRRRNPAIRIDNMCWQSTDDTLNWITNKLVRCDDKTAAHQQCCGECVVKPE